MKTAFTGSLQTYQLKRKITSVDLLELFGVEKNQIQNLQKKLAMIPEKFN